MIRGSIAKKYFQGIWGCNFAEEAGCIRHVKNIVTFTEKTKALFAINKGITDEELRKNPYKVNEAQRPEDRRVPFRNMIYLGDGLTDVPCFSLLDKMGGKAFAVFDPRKKGSPKKAWENLVAPKWVASVHSPKYGPEMIWVQSCVPLSMQFALTWTFGPRVRFTIRRYRRRLDRSLCISPRGTTWFSCWH